jgi:predicted GTPase
MKELGKNIFANFDMPESNYVSHMSHPLVHILMLGKCGVGKSKLVNNLCGTDLESGHSEKSLT